ncbi:uncharacterized protein LOC117642815 [Thrips palmi]|uniref:Uncharacterized protein LOC117642815 n=1 Tax=Thrips palmi TaxID=161013 RepID=A0A6P8YC89_THRPL|nr:uncharacterized protein LOC117642815 [Thrips palmi]
METVQVPPPAPIEVTVVSPHKPLKPDTANQVIISGPLAGIASLLSAVATSVVGTPGTASVSITENHAAKAEAVTPVALATEALATEALTTEPLTTEPLTPEAATQADTEDVTGIVIQDVTEATIDFVNKDATEYESEATTVVATEDTTPLVTHGNIKNAVTEVVKGAVAAAVGEAVEDAVKGVVKDTIKEIFRGEGKDLLQYEPVVNSVQAVAELMDDEDMQEDMPVVQNDVPVVNEETVPMTMMMSMVMDDAGPLSFDMSPVEEDDEAATEAPCRSSRSRRAADVFPDEFKTYVEMPTEDSTDEAPVETTTTTVEDDDVANEAEFADEGVFALPQYRGEAVAVGKKTASSGASDSLLALVKLRFALSAEARRQNFKNFQGYSDRVLAALTRTSSLTAREQLGVLLAGVLDQKAIKSPKTTKRAAVVLSELEDPKSELSRTLEDLPALKYSA